MKLTKEKVEKYFKSRTDEELRHCPECIACISKRFNELIGDMLTDELVGSIPTHTTIQTKYE